MSLFCLVIFGSIHNCIRLTMCLGWTIWSCWHGIIFYSQKKWQFHVDEPNNSRSYIVPQIPTSWYFNDKSEVGNLPTSFIKSIVKHYGVAGVWKAHGDMKAIPTNGMSRKRRETQHGQHVHHGPPASSTVSGFKNNNLWIYIAWHLQVIRKRVIKIQVELSGSSLSPAHVHSLKC